MKINIKRKLLLMFLLLSYMFLIPIVGSAKKKSYATGTKHQREGGGFVCECPTFFNGCVCILHGE